MMTISHSVLCNLYKLWTDEVRLIGVKEKEALTMASA